MSTVSVEAAVFNAFRANKFSSVTFISHITKIRERDVASAVEYLLRKRKIYQSVGGLPRRFSAVEELDSKKDESYE